jgi:hypothetical protein
MKEDDELIWLRGILVAGGHLKVYEVTSSHHLVLSLYHTLPHNEFLPRKSSRKTGSQRSMNFP